MKTYNWNQIAPTLAKHGVSYRQFDYWDRKDYLGETVEHIGSGNPRDVPWSMVARACMIGDLLGLGFALEKAVAYAAGMARSDEETFRATRRQAVAIVAVVRELEPESMPEMVD